MVKLKIVVVVVVLLLLLLFSLLLILLINLQKILLQLKKNYKFNLKGKIKNHNFEKRFKGKKIRNQK